MLSLYDPSQKSTTQALEGAAVVDSQVEVYVDDLPIDVQRILEGDLSNPEIKCPVGNGLRVSRGFSIIGGDGMEYHFSGFTLARRIDDESIIMDVPKANTTFIQYVEGEAAESLRSVGVSPYKRSRSSYVAPNGEPVIVENNAPLGGYSGEALERKIQNTQMLRERLAPFGVVVPEVVVAGFHSNGVGYFVYREVPRKDLIDIAKGAVEDVRGLSNVDTKNAQEASWAIAGEVWAIDYKELGAKLIRALKVMHDLDLIHGQFHHANMGIAIGTESPMVWDLGGAHELGEEYMFCNGKLESEGYSSSREKAKMGEAATAIYNISWEIIRNVAPIVETHSWKARINPAEVLTNLHQYFSAYMLNEYLYRGLADVEDIQSRLSVSERRIIEVMRGEEPGNRELSIMGILNRMKGAIKEGFTIPLRKKSTTKGSYVLPQKQEVATKKKKNNRKRGGKRVQ